MIINFCQQIVYIKSKLQQYSGITYRLRNFFNLRAANNFYYACVYSVLKYCICVWGGIFNDTNRGAPLQKLQSKIVSNLFSRFHVSNGCIFKKSRILKLAEIHRFNVAVYMFKIIKLGECQHLSRLLEIVYPNHTYGTRNIDKLILPLPRINSVRINFEYQFLKLWNEVPNYMKDITSLRRFKKEYFNYLIEFY